MALTKYYNLTEVADLLSITERTMRDYVSRGVVKGVKIGGRWKIAETEVRKLTGEEAFTAPKKGRPRKTGTD